jgi:hypothetical protein
MRTITLVSATFLLGSLACSSNGRSLSQERPVSTLSQALNAADADTAAADAATSSASQVGTAFPSHAAAASASLNTLRHLVARGDPQIRGFRSVEEVGQAAVSAPMPMFMVKSALRTYQRSQDPRTLMFDRQTMMYPVAVDGDVRTSVVVLKRADGLWEAVEFGNMNLVKAACGFRQRVITSRGIAETALSLVYVPMVEAYLLAHQEKGGLMMTPLNDTAGSALHAGDTYTAEDVFVALQPVAAQAPKIGND